MGNYQALKGFTLIELMIVVSIVGILAMFGYPGYLDHVRKTARKEAIGKILETANRVEQFKTQRFAYPSSDSELSSFDDSTVRYEYDVNSVEVSGAVVGYTVTATPVSGGSQVSDRCGTLVYNSSGTWVFSNSLTEEECL